MSSSSYHTIHTNEQLANLVTQSTKTTGGYIYRGDSWSDYFKSDIEHLLCFDVLSRDGNVIVDREIAMTINKQLLAGVPVGSIIEHVFSGENRTYTYYQKMVSGDWEVIQYDNIQDGIEWSLISEQREQAEKRARDLKAERERAAFMAADTRFAALAALKGR